MRDSHGEKGPGPETLRESEERYRKVFLHSNDAILVIDPDRDAILDANPRACELLAYSRDELLNSSISEIHPTEMPALETFARSVMREGHSWTNELSCLTKTGRSVPAEISASTTEFAGRRCIIAMVRDIAERQQAAQAHRELAVMEERTRLAREIHDSIAQGLTGIIWQLNAAEQSALAGGEAAVEQIRRVRELARASLQECRRSVWDLRAGPLGGGTLAQALEKQMETLAGGVGVHSTLTVEGQETVLPSGVEVALLRIGTESLFNMARHAGATEAQVTLTYDGSQVRLEIRDDGMGFDPDVPVDRGADTGGFGLINMRERARLLGGTLTVKSEPGGGTLVEAVLPLT